MGNSTISALHRKINRFPFKTGTANDNLTHHMPPYGAKTILSEMVPLFANQ